MPTFMRTFSIFCVFLFFSGFAFGQTKTVTLNILDAIDENPSFFDTLVIYDLTAKKVVFFSDKKESKIELKLEKGKKYEYYGMYDDRRQIIIEIDTIDTSNSSFDLYVYRPICTLQIPYYFKDDSTQISNEMIEQIELINKIISSEKEDEDLILEVYIGVGLLQSENQSKESKSRLKAVENMFEKQPIVTVHSNTKSSMSEYYSESYYLNFRIIQDADIKKVRTLVKTYSDEKKSPKIYKK